MSWKYNSLADHRNIKTMVYWNEKERKQHYIKRTKSGSWDMFSYINGESVYVGNEPSSEYAMKYFASMLANKPILKGNYPGDINNWKTL